MREELRRRDGDASQRDGGTKPPALLVRLTSPARVHIIAADWGEEQEAKPLAELVEHVLRTALQRPTGTA